MQTSGSHATWLSLRAGLRLLVLNVRSVVLLPAGLIYYAMTRRTPEVIYQSFVWAFCMSRGGLNDALSASISRWRRKAPMGRPTGVLGELTDQDIERHVRSLRANGYVVFSGALPSDMCDRLAKFAAETQARVRVMDGQSDTVRREWVLFDPKQPLAVRYDYDTNALLQNADVQALLADASILSMAQEYLNCLPVADVLSMWWHTNFGEGPDAMAAQFYHFDMDRIKWLKVFIYLTDVGPDNGPHSFVSGSHRTGAIPVSMLRKGYARLTDEEVSRAYSAERRLQLCAPRGTIILEDTRGLHKGAHVTGAPRLMLQLQFSNSLFGTTYPAAHIQEIKDPSFKRMVSAAPAIYRQYI